MTEDVQTSNPDPPQREISKEEIEVRKLEERLEGRGWLARQFIMASEGLKFWKFDAKAWAIWHTSSWATLANVAFLSSLWSWLKLNWATVCIPMIKKVFLVVKATIIGLVVTGH